MNERDQIRFQWQFASDEDPAVVQLQRKRLKRLDPEGVLVGMKEMKGLLPILLIAGAISAVILAREIERYICRLRRSGLIIDTRTVPVDIRPAPQLPGGAVIVIGKDGVSTQHEVCGRDKVDLAQVLKASAGGA